MNIPADAKILIASEQYDNYVGVEFLDNKAIENPTGKLHYYQILNRGNSKYNYDTEV